MKKKYTYLLLSLAGTAISFYGCKKVHEAVRDEYVESLPFGDINITVNGLDTDSDKESGINEDALSELRYSCSL